MWPKSVKFILLVYNNLSNICYVPEPVVSSEDIMNKIQPLPLMKIMYVFIVSINFSLNPNN